MRLWAISDLHLLHPRNREAFETFPSFPDDWLILAGDIVGGHHRFDWCLNSLKRKFRQIVWVPGNHELWVRPGTAGEPRGVALYDKLVAIARRHGVMKTCSQSLPRYVIENQDLSDSGAVSTDRAGTLRQGLRAVRAPLCG